MVVAPAVPIDVQQDHDGSGTRNCKSSGQNAGPIDFTAEPFREGVHARHSIGREAAEQSPDLSLDKLGRRARVPHHLSHKPRSDD
jgi:hypothetical protein